MITFGFRRFYPCLLACAVIQMTGCCASPTGSPCFPSGRSCVTFDALAQGTTYTLGDSFTDGGTLVWMAAFQQQDGTWPPGNHARVDAGARAGGTGNSLNLNNVTAEIGVGCARSLILSFGDYGGNENLRINGDLRNVAKVSDLDGATVGGAHVKVVLSSPPGAHNELGHLTATGDITQFSIGGQELWIDDVCFERP